MKDNDIIDLYRQRDEAAIEATKEKYGGLCFSVAYNILGDRGEAEEVVNDTYLGVWNSIPPHLPQILSAFVVKIARNLSLKRLRHNTADKRNGVVGELFESICDSNTVDSVIEEKELASAIDRFLRELKPEERIVFLRRYFFFDSVFEIADRMGATESKIKMQLLRTRQKLAQYLEQEGIYL